MILNTYNLNIRFSYYKNGNWNAIPDEFITEAGFHYQKEDALYYCNFEKDKNGLFYKMGFDTSYETKLKLELELVKEKDLFHLIPCNIYGDNNAKEAKPGEFQLLTYDNQEFDFCSPYWEFRADRSATPLSALCCEKGVVGVTIKPYAELETAYIHNGLFANLPNKFGVTLGYTNLPVTVINKRTHGPSTGETACKAETEGIIYALSGDGRLEIHKIIREEYFKIHERATYKKTYRQATKGLLDSFVNLNWNDKDKEYTNRDCQVPKNTKLKPWRNVVEIGWTGGSVLAYPLILSRYVISNETKDAFVRARSGEEIIDRIVNSYNEASGLLNDLTIPRDESGSLVNGWWADFGLVKDSHCAYNVGSAIHYILKSILFLKEQEENYKEEWLTTCKKVIDTVIELQRSDGAFGYTYSISSKKVNDWSGFAGCWFASCSAYLYHLTAEEKYITAAKKALYYYSSFVKKLNCYGTPMDTWKSVDQEGNLAFIRGCRLVHEYTGEKEFLKLLEIGANYEYLWRYSFKSRPEFNPIKESWNSCGGSVTSVSNPHIHPMGVIIDSDLRYLTKITGDTYHEMRAMDSSAWLMQTLELYPEKTGYGRYGVLSERWCPSDGLTVERYSDGTPCSSWFSYNLWAAANAFEAVCELILDK